MLSDVQLRVERPTVSQDREFSPPFAKVSALFSRSFQMLPLSSRIIEENDITPRRRIISSVLRILITNFCLSMLSFGDEATIHVIRCKGILNQRGTIV